MPAQKISLENAKTDKLFYFVANVIVYRESDGRCLILKRSDRETVHPNKWALPGGKLQWDDLDIEHPTKINDDVIDFDNTTQKLIEREAFEEAGVHIKLPIVFINDVTFIRPDETPVVLVKFAARYKSGEIKLEEGAFSEFKWVDEKEIKQYDTIQGTPNDIAATIAAFNAQKPFQTV